MKIWNWLVTAVLLVAAAFFATKSRRHKQRSEAATDKEVKILAENKQENLTKAAKLDQKATKSLEMALKAKETSEQLANQLENRDAKSLADSVRDFNSSL